MGVGALLAGVTSVASLVVREAEHAQNRTQCHYRRGYRADPSGRIGYRYSRSDVKFEPSRQLWGNSRLLDERRN
jgi:hypothetical protein